jgi:cysteine desulfurase
MSSKSTIYLDYAAATPLDARVEGAMRPYLAADFYNPSAQYQAARGVHAALEAARAQAAHWLGARGSEIIFTAGGTEANNLAIHGVMRQFPAANVVVSAVEHESVLAPAGRYDCREAAVTPDGRVDLGDVRAKIDDRTVLVSIMYANNEIGTVQPIREIARLLAEIRKKRRAEGNESPLYFHTDAAQAANYLDLHVARLGVNMMTLNGGKIYGPKQSGCLYVKAGVELTPLIDGGGQERGLRSGTENVAAAVGFAAALDTTQTMRRDESARLLKLQRKFIEGIQQRIPQAVVNGSLKYRLPNNVHVTLPGQDNERLLIELDEAGIMAAAGSACSASSEESSHVLHALGMDDAAARASLRFTMGRSTTLEVINKTIKGVSQLAKT